MTYAGFWKRFAASIIDGLILGVVMWFVGFVVAPESTVGQLVLIVVWWLYFAGWESSERQATLGKTVLDIKVSDLQGGRTGFGRATARHFGKFLSALLLGIGFLMVPFTQKRQALHDLLAGCLVVKA